MTAVSGVGAVPVERTHIKIAPLDTLITLVLLIGGGLMMLPFLWMFSTSLRDAAESFSLPPMWLPTQVHSENYQSVLSGLPLIQFVINSVKIATLITLGQLATCSLAPVAMSCSVYCSGR